LPHIPAIPPSNIPYFTPPRAGREDLAQLAYYGTQYLTRRHATRACIAPVAPYYHAAYTHLFNAPTAAFRRCYVDCGFAGIPPAHAAALRGADRTRHLKTNMPRCGRPQYYTFFFGLDVTYVSYVYSDVRF